MPDSKNGKLEFFRSVPKAASVQIAAARVPIGAGQIPKSAFGGYLSFSADPN